MQKRTIKEIIRKISKRLFLRSADGIIINKIDEVDIVPTLKCNLNCAMCHQAQIKHKESMTLDNFKKIIIKLKGIGVTKISLVGGEILVLPDIWNMIEFLEEMKIKYDLATNAVLLNDDLINKIKKLKYLEKISTSIDGDRILHNKIRGSEIAYDRTINNIKKLLAAKIRVNVGCVVQKENFNKLEEIFDNLYSIGVKDISFLFELRVNDIQKEVTKKIIKKITGKDAEIYISSTKNRLGELTEEELMLITSKFEKIKARAKERGVSIGLPIQLSDKGVLSREYNPRDYTCAIFKGYNLQIFTKGEFNFCPFISLGDEFSLNNKKPFEIQNSKEYVSLRSAFKNSGVLPICRNCCALTKKD